MTLTDLIFKNVAKNAHSAVSSTAAVAMARAVNKQWAAMLPKVSPRASVAMQELGSALQTAKTVDGKHDVNCSFVIRANNDMDVVRGRTTFEQVPWTWTFVRKVVFEHGIFSAEQMDSLPTNLRNLTMELKTWRNSNTTQSQAQALHVDREATITLTNITGSTYFDATTQALVVQAARALFTALSRGATNASHATGGGKAKSTARSKPQRTTGKEQTTNGLRSVYIGPRGGRYIKMHGRFVAL